LGAGPGVEGQDLDGGVVHLGQRRDRELRVGDAAGEEDAGGQERGSDRAEDEQAGWIHRPRPPGVIAREDSTGGGPVPGQRTHRASTYSLRSQPSSAATNPTGSSTRRWWNVSGTSSDRPHGTAPASRRASSPPMTALFAPRTTSVRQATAGRNGHGSTGGWRKTRRSKDGSHAPGARSTPPVSPRWRRRSAGARVSGGASLKRSPASPRLAKRAGARPACRS